MSEVNLKDLINQYNVEKGWDVTDDNEELYETFEECSDTVYMGDPDEHRWYTCYDVVRMFTVGGVDYFFSDYVMRADGDNSRDDCGWETPDVESIEQVFPKQVLTTIYVSKDKL